MRLTPAEISYCDCKAGLYDVDQESRQKRVKELIEQISTELARNSQYSGVKVIVVGSTQQHTARSDSDVDLLIKLPPIFLRKKK